MEKELLVVDQVGSQLKVQKELQGMQVTCIAVDPFCSQRLYCGTFNRGLWKSDDAGQTWEAIGDPCLYTDSLDESGILHASITAIAVSPTKRIGNYGVVYVGTEPSAVFYSEDGGETWKEFKSVRALPSASTWSFPPRPHTSHVRWITPDFHHENRLSVSIEFGAVIRSFDGGENWEDKKFGGPLDVHTLLMHPTIPDRLYAACGDGYFQPGRGFLESKDFGETWQPNSDGLEHHYLYSLAVDVRDPNIMIVSAAKSPYYAHHAKLGISTIYRKEGDQPWQEVRTGLPASEGTTISMLAAHPQKAHQFYALNNHGLFVSDDKGVTWERFDFPWDELYLEQRARALLVLEY
ncbi:glycosyl hydrolase [Thermoflavimicrobium daqui]|uniref:Glycosyl hydrolase n=2 Tax=Thermoflavimicrobium daqui TaxID=2137476 RepID=A0A364K4H6_9BACL|nr:glycosyl hydrolase [Thermoflavimicrobium daqui]